MDIEEMCRQLLCLTASVYLTRGVSVYLYYAFVTLNLLHLWFAGVASSVSRGESGQEQDSIRSLGKSFEEAWMHSGSACIGMDSASRG